MQCTCDLNQQKRPDVNLALISMQNKALRTIICICMQVRVFLRAEWAVLLDTSSLPLPFPELTPARISGTGRWKIFSLGEG